MYVVTDMSKNGIMTIINSQVEAEAEALRLANNHSGKRFYICKALQMVKLEPVIVNLVENEEPKEEVKPGKKKKVQEVLEVKAPVVVESVKVSEEVKQEPKTVETILEEIKEVVENTEGDIDLILTPEGVIVETVQETQEEAKPEVEPKSVPLCISELLGATSLEKLKAIHESHPQEVKENAQYSTFYADQVKKLEPFQEPESEAKKNTSLKTMVRLRFNNCNDIKELMDARKALIEANPSLENDPYFKSFYADNTQRIKAAFQKEARNMMKTLNVSEAEIQALPPIEENIPELEEAPF
jgi:hypothetical protein